MKGHTVLEVTQVHHRRSGCAAQTVVRMVGGGIEQVRLTWRLAEWAPITKGTTFEVSIDRVLAGVASERASALRPWLGEYNHPRWHLSCAGCSALVEDDGEEAQGLFLERAWAEGWRAVEGELVCAGCGLGRGHGTHALRPAHQAVDTLFGTAHAACLKLEQAIAALENDDAAAGMAWRMNSIMVAMDDLEGRLREGTGGQAAAVVARGRGEPAP